MSTTLAPSKEYVALLEESRRTDFSEWEAIGKHNRVLSVVGKTREGADIFVFCPGVLGASADLNKLLLFFLRETDAIINHNPRGYAMILHAADFGRSVASFLRKVYKMLGRAFKKNIRHLLIVHPTYGLKTLVFIARPFISKKFWSKMKYFATHQELLACEPLRGADYYQGCVRHGGALKLPDKVYLAQSETPPQSARYFGCPLRIQPIRSDSTNNSQPTGCPLFILDCIQVLSEGNGLATEGLFRISADAESVREVRSTLESGYSKQTRIVDSVSGRMAMNGNDVHGRHVVSALFKAFLRELPEPIFPHAVYKPLMELYRTCKEMSSQEASMGVFISGTNSLIENALSPLQRVTLVTVMRFLNRVASFSSENKMDGRNIAVCLAPNVLQPPNQGNAASNLPAMNVAAALEETNMAIGALTWIIENVDEVFHSGAGGSGEVVVALEGQIPDQSTDNQSEGTSAQAKSTTSRVPDRRRMAGKWESPRSSLDEVDVIEEKSENDESLDAPTSTREVTSAKNPAMEDSEQKKEHDLLTAKIAAMSPEERALFERKQDEEAAHEKKKDKALKQMARSYGGGKKKKKGKGKKGRMSIKS